jgi:hypothetical protein
LPFQAGLVLAHDVKGFEVRRFHFEDGRLRDGRNAGGAIGCRRGVGRAPSRGVLTGPKLSNMPWHIVRKAASSSPGSRMDLAVKPCFKEF